MLQRLAATSGLVSLLVACAPREPAPPQGSPEPQSGGVFRFALTEPSTLDPAHSEDTYQWQLNEQIFDGLVELDPDLNVVPSLARTWTVSRNGLVYTFLLRDDVRFHNGRSVTSGDVAWSFLRAARVEDGLAREYLKHVEGLVEAAASASAAVPGIELDGPGKIVVRLAAPHAPFLAALAIPQLRVVPREEIETRGEADFGRRPVGSGPFRVEEWGKGRMRLLPHRARQRGRPYLDEVVVRFGDWEADAVERFGAGELDMAFLGREAKKRLAPGSKVVQRLELGVTCLGLSVSTGPMRDPLVRRAAALALDREALVEASGRIAVATRSVVPDGLPGGGSQALAPEQDLAEARRLLAEAGQPQGRGLQPLEVWVNSESAPALATARVLVRQLEAVGIPARERAAAWGAFLDEINAKRAPAYLLTWVADTPDRDSYLGLLFHSRGVNNLLGFVDPEVDQLLDAARSELDPLARMNLYRGVERRVSQANVLVPLYNQANVFAVRSGLEGFALDPFGHVDLSRLWWARGP